MTPSQVGNKAKSPEKGVSDDQDLQVDNVGGSDDVEDIQLIPNELFLNCIDRDSMELMSIPSISYEICIQRRINLLRQQLYSSQSLCLCPRNHILNTAKMIVLLMRVFVMKIRLILT